MGKRKGTQLGTMEQYISKYEVLHFLNTNLKKGRYSEHKKLFTAKLWIPDIDSIYNFLI